MNALDDDNFMVHLDYHLLEQHALIDITIKVMLSFKKAKRHALIFLMAHITF